jgi:4-amino-4-deoxy-L-arabinose transferase-like glycosyltransferase
MSLSTLLPTLRKAFDKWRLLFLLFIFVFVLFLLLDLGSMTIQWDEVNHLNGGLLLLQGRGQEYMGSAMFYPPLYDVLSASFFAVGGVSVFVGRLVAVVFSVLSVWAVFEFAGRVYGHRVAILSSLFFGSMPGFVWLSRVSLLETMLIFFFSVSMFLFFAWLRTPKNWLLVLCGVVLGLGFLTKYQMIVGLMIMVTSVFFLFKGQIRARLSRIPILVLVAFVVVLPWIVISFQAYSSGMLDQWLYAMSIGNPDKTLFSVRFPIPIFYLIEMAWPYGVVRPVSIIVYALGLVGLVLLLWKRKPEDKYLLVWFFVSYVFFSLIGNRQWRYIVPVFPVLAISSARLVVFAFEKLEGIRRLSNPKLNMRILGKAAAVCLALVVAFSVIFSCVDCYNWVSKDRAFDLPLENATDYVVSRVGVNESFAILCPINVFSADITRFYSDSKKNERTDVWQYPTLPVDTYTPSFSIQELTSFCELRNAKYLLLFEYGGTYPYFNSSLNMQGVNSLLVDSQRFSVQTIFGDYPSRIFVLSFS